MIDGIIYKIEIGEDFYIGSTETTLKIREKRHNNDLKWRNQKLQKFCKENNINKITLIELEKVKIENKLELRIIEQDYINKLQPSLNSQKAHLTKEDKIDYIKKYYQNNKDNYKKTAYIWDNKKVDCEFCGLEMNRSSLSRHKKKSCKNKI
tara:strand:- start:406 stop:858 length:453 start_codon:yes stop_codon:yes gene_type:complete